MVLGSLIPGPLNNSDVALNVFRSLKFLILTQGPMIFLSLCIKLMLLKMKPN